jgi:hypothetical protein
MTKKNESVKRAGCSYSRIVAKVSSRKPSFRHIEILGNSEYKKEDPSCYAPVLSTYASLSLRREVLSEEY